MSGATLAIRDLNDSAAVRLFGTSRGLGPEQLQKVGALAKSVLDLANRRGVVSIQDLKVQAGTLNGSILQEDEVAVLRRAVRDL